MVKLKLIVKFGSYTPQFNILVMKELAFKMQFRLEEKDEEWKEEEGKN